MKYILASGATFALLSVSIAGSGCGEAQYDAPPPPPTTEQPPPPQTTQPGMSPGEGDPTPGTP